MADPGLSNRLRQHSRRAGLTVGLSMALTIAICVGGFTVIYAGLAPLVSDVVPASAPEPTAAPTNAPAPAPTAEAEAEAPAPEVAVAAETAAEATTAPTEEAVPTATESAFQPDFQIGPNASINLRPEPSTNNTPIVALSPDTPLLYLDEEEPATDGTTWRRFRTEDGQEGWIRDLDVVPYQDD